jgi:hypothetical protein
MQSRLPGLCRRKRRYSGTWQPKASPLHTDLTRLTRALFMPLVRSFERHRYFFQCVSLQITILPSQENPLGMKNLRSFSFPASSTPVGATRITRNSSFVCLFPCIVEGAATLLGW